MVERGEVVHGDHLGRPPGRGHDEIRPVHHVDRADEPFDGWPGAAPPQGVERAGRHRALGCRDPGRQVGADPRPPAPADGEGAHVEVGARPQGPECAEAEDPDAGRRTEERRGIERHPESSRQAWATVHCEDALGTVGALHMAQAVIAPSTERIVPVT